MRRNATRDAWDAREHHDACQDTQDAREARKVPGVSRHSACASDAGLIFADVLEILWLGVVLLSRVTGSSYSTFETKLIYYEKVVTP